MDGNIKSLSVSAGHSPGECLDRDGHHAVDSLNPRTSGMMARRKSLPITAARMNAGHSSGVGSNHRGGFVELGKPKLWNWRDGYEGGDSTARPIVVDDSIWCANSDESEDNETSDSLHSIGHGSVCVDGTPNNLKIRISRRKVSDLDDSPVPLLKTKVRVRDSTACVRKSPARDDRKKSQRDGRLVHRFDPNINHSSLHQAVDTPEDNVLIDTDESSDATIYQSVGLARKSSGRHVLKKPESIGRIGRGDNHKKNGSRNRLLNAADGSNVRLSTDIHRSDEMVASEHPFWSTQTNHRREETSRYIRPTKPRTRLTKFPGDELSSRTDTTSKCSSHTTYRDSETKLEEERKAIDLCHSDTASTCSFVSPAPCETDFSFDPLSSATAVAFTPDHHCTTEYAAPDFLDYDRTYMASRKTKHRRTNPSLDRTITGPSIAYSSIPLYDHEIDSAPRRDFLFVCERPNLSSYVPTMEPREPLMWPETHAVDIWRRGMKGIALRNRLDVCNHYEIDGANLDRFQRDATQKGIRPVYHPADGKVKMVNHEGHHLFLCNGGDFQGILEDMDLRSIFDDLSHKSDPGLVPKKNKRGNRGPSLIYTGSQSTDRPSASQFAVPNLSAGSRRYAPLFLKITKAIRVMAAHRLSDDHESFPQPFPKTDEMPDRELQWGGRVIEGNCIESCSLLIYISDHSFSKDGCDKLKPHVDKGNGVLPGWDLLATFWEEFFCPDIGRWILFVVSATTRRSIEEYNDRKGCIGFATDEILRRYSEHPECQKHVVPNTLCPKSVKGDHRVTPIHFDTLVFLSVPLWHIHRMRKYWVSRGQKMSLFLAQEMIVGFFKTNNPLRYHRFADKVYRETVASGCLAIPSKSTFLQELEAFLFITFGGWNGSSNARGVVEGSMRFQTTTNSPQTDWAQDKALIFWNNFSTELASRFVVKCPTEKDHLSAIRAMKNAVIGVGELLAQKIIFADATLGLTLPLSFLANCTPGSSQHVKVLKRTPFNFKHSDQVRQLVTSIAVKGQMVRQKAEEAICLTLKSDTSLGMYAETSVKECDLFSSTVDRDQRLSVRRLDYGTREQVPVERGGFTASQDSHYYPSWAKYRDPSKYCSNNVRMTSRANFIFNVKPKVTATQIRDLEEESVHSAVHDIDFGVVQVLLNSNKYLFLEDPIDELARYFRVSKQKFIQSIEVRHKGDGFIPFLETEAFAAVRLDSAFLQVSEIGVSRRPMVDVGDTSCDGWNYQSRNGAILALFVHCITNVHLRHGNHWAIEYLHDTKEFVLLLPATSGLDTASAVGTFFRNVDENIRFRQITRSCEVLSPLIVAKDYNGVFQRNVNVRRMRN
jgi:hypothetical protein